MRLRRVGRLFGGEGWDNLSLLNGFIGRDAHGTAEGHKEARRNPRRQPPPGRLLLIEGAGHGAFVEDMRNLDNRVEGLFEDRIRRTSASESEVR